MTFKLMEYVIAVSEEGSFSRAAQRLFISQPALSQAIRRAEEALGAEFFLILHGHPQLHQQHQRTAHQAAARAAEKAQIVV